MNSITMKSALRMITECFLVCFVAGAGMNAVAATHEHSGGGLHGGGFHSVGIHSGGFHGSSFRNGSFHGNGFRGVFDAYGWSGRGVHRPHYWGGFYIGSEWFWGPTIVVSGTPYYYYSGVYYTPYGDADALVAVTPPIAEPATDVSGPSTSPDVASAPAKVEPKATKPSGETVTINVPNAGGGFTPVQLVKTDKGYVGPQGEFYAGHPTVSQLKALYGE